MMSASVVEGRFLTLSSSFVGGLTDFAVALMASSKGPYGMLQSAGRRRSEWKLNESEPLKAIRSEQGTLSVSFPSEYAIA